MSAVEAIDVGDPAGEPLCVQVIFGEPFDIVLQGIDPCCRQDSSLSHAAAELLAEAMSPLHKWLGADHERPYRCPQSLRKAQRA